MLKLIKKITKYLLLLLLLVILLPIGGASFLYFTSEIVEPQLVADTSNNNVKYFDTHREVNNGLFRVSESGLLEAKVKGNPSERGVAIGSIMSDYLGYQEGVFIDQIMEIIPSEDYLSFLRGLIVIFNRNITDNIPIEYQQEILGISQYCTHKYDAIGTPFERQLNYHAAHDIGHAMQQYMLVGCSSFVLDGNNSEEKELIVGRNFDFYVGDDFAKNKLVMFVEPDAGYKFASIGWAGMMGVLSGMNEKGLTVTINAAKGSMPLSSSTPISILAREILQYASNLEEAVGIAKRRNTFVSESILVSSAFDKNAIIIEKTPSEIDVYQTDEYPLICTNHYQSDKLKESKENIENIKTSDSDYRYKIIEELLSKKSKNNLCDVASILRNRYGKAGKDIGLGNEMSLNQSIVHHSVIFMPESRLMWVSTSPWQSGKFVCYDLNKVFNNDDFSKEIYENDREIDMDTLFMESDYKRVVDYRNGVKRIKDAIWDELILSTKELDEFQNINPNNYYTYRLLGDYYSEIGEEDIAKKYYKESLKREIPQLGERRSIEKLSRE